MFMKEEGKEPRWVVFTEVMGGEEQQPQCNEGSERDQLKCDIVIYGKINFIHYKKHTKFGYFSLLHVLSRSCFTSRLFPSLSLTLCHYRYDSVFISKKTLLMLVFGACNVDGPASALYLLSFQLFSWIEHAKDKWSIGI